jgi:nitronate monooxygenase
MGFGNRKKLKIGQLELEKPIIQGGMGVGISLAGLASAVANEGGIGVIATPGIGIKEPDFITNFREANRRGLRKEIEKARELSKGIIGVNIMLALSNSKDLIEVAVEEEADVVFLSAGLPLKFPSTLSQEALKKNSTQFVPIVSSARAAKIIFQSWEKYDKLPDALVIEGPKAGGHLGFKKEQIDNPDYSIERILPEVISYIAPFEHKYNIKVPIFVGGGVFTGEDIHNFLQMGAHGVQMATRFVGTHECDADIQFKKAYINANKNDLKIINSPLGLPGRAINNKFLEEVEAGIKKPFTCPYKCLRTCNFKDVSYCIADALSNAKDGKLEEGFAFAGTNAYRVKKIISVKELFEALEEEYLVAENKATSTK